MWCSEWLHCLQAHGTDSEINSYTIVEDEENVYGKWGEDTHEWQQGIYGTSLHLLLNFAVNLNLLQKNNIY